jgi:moderate conductance mechanosensitive channel
MQLNGAKTRRYLRRWLHRSLHGWIYGPLPGRQHRTWFYRWSYRLISWGILLLLSLSLLVGAPLSSPGMAQPNPSAPTSLPSPLRQFETNLSNINSLFDLDSSEIARGTIRLDGRRLFTIATPALPSDSKTAPGLSPIESRVEIIENRLRQIVEQGFDPDSLRVEAITDSSSRQPVIYVQYSRDGEPKRDELMTVTALDAEINGTSAENRADEISDRLETALRRAASERQPDFLRQQALWAAAVLLLVGGLSLVVTSWQRRLRQERQGLSAQSRSASSELAAPQAPESATVLLQQKTANQRRQRFNDIKRRLFQLLQLLLWATGLVLILGLFPQTRWLRPLILDWVQIPIRLLAVVLLTYLAIRFSEVLIDHLFWVLQSGTSLATDTSQRLVLRFTTFSRVAKSIAVLVLGSLGLMIAVAAIGIPINPGVLTLAGIAGVGVSLASQNLIKDVINGFLILLEDQYGVGDVVMIGDMSGLVENMNLRITQLRSSQGHLITIPNSSISVVQNLSKEWSRVDLNVSVAYEADIDQALAVIDQVAQTLSTDPSWQALILEKPQLLGVENLDYAGATVRLWIKTQPLKQWEVAREYRRRLKLAFDQAGISVGVPNQALWFNNAADVDWADRADSSKSSGPQPFDEATGSPKAREPRGPGSSARPHK